MATISAHDVADLLEARLSRLVTAPRPAWLTVSMAAEYSSLSEESIRKLLSSGKLTARRPVKGRVLVSRLELDDLIRNSTAQPRVGRGIRQGGA